jgi:hypothetical protein
MLDPMPMATPDHAIARSVPPISRLSYFDVLFGVLRDHSSKLDDLRVAIGRHVEDLSSRGEARRTRDWRKPLAYRDTIVACARELIRWGYVTPMPLGDDVASYERARELPVQLTEEGHRLAAMKVAERREVIGQKLLGTYLLFQDLLEILRNQDVLLPEFPDSTTRTFFPMIGRAADDEGAWRRVAEGCEPFLS